MEQAKMPIEADLATLERRNPLAIEQLKNIMLMRQLREAHEVIDKYKASEKSEKEPGSSQDVN